LAFLIAMLIEEVIAAYIHDCRFGAFHEMRFFANQRDLQDAVRYAALCILSNGKRHPHQRRLPKALLREAERRLQLVRDEVSSAQHFADLHAVVERELSPLQGVGDLTVYDIAHRIGAFLGKGPDLVYLHAGTKVGAAALGIRGKAVSPNMFPIAFSVLTSAEIEDCLCIYKGVLGHSGFYIGMLQPPEACKPAVLNPVRKC
jgi:hypothetical protein